MSLVLSHDGSWPGFLCAVAEYLNLLRGPNASRAGLRIEGPGLQAGLDDEIYPVTRDEQRAHSLLLRLIERIGGESNRSHVRMGQDPSPDRKLPTTKKRILVGDEITRRVLRSLQAVFCSDTPGSDDAAAWMIARVFTVGTRAFDELGQPKGALFEKARNRLEREAHLFYGHSRFAELEDGSYYACIRPDCDVLLFIAEYFAARFPGMIWLIRDEKRGSGLSHTPGEGWSYWPVLEGPGGPLPLSDYERAIQAAWTVYHRDIAIRQRFNPKLQKAFLPQKFRHPGEPLGALPCSQADS